MPHLLSLLLQTTATDTPLGWPGWVWAVILVLFTAAVSHLINRHAEHSNRAYSKVKEKQDREEVTVENAATALLARMAGVENQLLQSEKTRELDKLRHEGDFATVTGILQRSMLVAEQMTTITEKTRWHNQELIRHDKDFEKVHSDIRQLNAEIIEIIRSHGKHHD